MTKSGWMLGMGNYMRCWYCFPWLLHLWNIGDGIATLTDHSKFHPPTSGVFSAVGTAAISSSPSVWGKGPICVAMMSEMSGLGKWNACEVSHICEQFCASTTTVWFKTWHFLCRLTTIYGPRNLSPKWASVLNPTQAEFFSSSFPPGHIWVAPSLYQGNFSWG